MPELDGVDPTDNWLSKRYSAATNGGFEDKHEKGKK